MKRFAIFTLIVCLAVAVTAFLTYAERITPRRAPDPFIGRIDGIFEYEAPNRYQAIVVTVIFSAAAAIGIGGAAACFCFRLPARIKSLTLLMCLGAVFNIPENMDKALGPRAEFREVYHQLIWVPVGALVGAALHYILWGAGKGLLCFCCFIGRFLDSLFRRRHKSHREYMAFVNSLPEPHRTAFLTGNWDPVKKAQPSTDSNQSSESRSAI